MKTVTAVIFAAAVYAGVACTSFFGGIVVAFHSLEYSQIVEVRDGREDFRIALHFGPFSYTINVEERRP